MTGASRNSSENAPTLDAPPIVSTIEGLAAILDSLAANVLVADADRKFVFINKKAGAALRILKQPLLRAFGVDVDDLLGKSIHTFHRDPEAIERVLNAPELFPYTARFAFENVVLRAKIERVDFGAESHGFVVVWDDVSAERDRERYERILRAVDAATTGDFSRRLDESGSDVIAGVAKRVNGFLSAIERAFAEVDGETKAVAGAACELTETSLRLSADAQSASSRAEGVAAAGQQLSEAIRNVAANSATLGAEVRAIAASAGNATETAESAVAEAEAADAIMRGLGRSGQEVVEVLKTISSIAELTNMLALNATIEAARAGESGAGFAVVAREVKELAKRTGAATADIEKKIVRIHSDTTKAAESLARIRKTVDEINRAQAEISDAVVRHTSAAALVERGTSEAAGAVVEIARMVADASIASEKTLIDSRRACASAKEVSQLATGLKQVVRRFRPK